jgi:hypothetical protein
MCVTPSADPEWVAKITVDELDHDPYPVYARMRSEAHMTPDAPRRR